MTTPNRQPQPSAPGRSIIPHCFSSISVLQLRRTETLLARLAQNSADIRHLANARCLPESIRALKPSNDRSAKVAP